MKKIICLFAAVGLLAGVTGCKKEKPVGPDPAGVEVIFNVTVDENAVTAISATLVIESQNVEKYAYILNPDNSTSAPDVIFAIGTVGNIAGNRTLLTLNNLEPKTAYTVAVAAQVDEDTYYDDVVEVEFTTTDFTDEVTLYGVTYDSFAMHVNLPEEVAKRVTSGETAIRSMALDLFTYMLRTNGMFGVSPDAYILAESGRDDYYPDNVHKTASFTRVFDEAHMQPSGEGWDDPEEIDNAFYYYPIVPGQPMVVMMGEFAYKEPDYAGDWFGYIAYQNYFDEEAFFDDYTNGSMEPAAGSMFFETQQDKYWSGYYKRLELVTEKPASLAAGVKPVSHITPVGGSIDINPEEGVYQYVFTLFNQDALDLAMSYLNNKEEYLPWFITSFTAFINIDVYSASGPTSINLDDVFYGVTPGEVITLAVVSMGDQAGHTQNFQKFEFTVPESNKPAPVLEVTAISNPSGEEDPYSIWFNIKSVGSEPVYLLKYAANDKTSWDALLAISDYDEVLDNYGNEITAMWNPDEIAAINSPEGLDVEFWSRDEETTVLAVKAMNDEGVYSSAVWAENTTIADYVEPVESDLYTALEGDWTITIPVTAQYEDQWDYDEENDEWIITPGEQIYRQLTGKVTIGNVTYPATLTEDVYELYANTAGYDREATDAMYDNFKASVDAFNARTKSRNRILMNGFPGSMDWDLGENVSEALTYASPYELFTSPDYNGASVSSIVADFGPKWYLQLNADGTVCVPVNYYLNPKLTGWMGDNWALIVGDAITQSAFAVLEGNLTIEVPVEISDDRNTITIRPFVYADVVYRLGCGREWGGGSGYFEYNGVTYDDIVLTRGWNGDVPSVASVRTGKKLDVHKIEKSKNAPRSITLDRTTLKGKGTAAKRTEIKAEPISAEQFKANVEKYAKGMQRARK